MIIAALAVGLTLFYLIVYRPYRNKMLTYDYLDNKGIEK